MGYSATRIGRVRFAAQSSSWGTFAASGFSTIQCDAPEFDFPTETADVTSIRAKLGAAPDNVKGHQAGGTLTLKFRMHGLHTSGAGITSNPTNTAESTLIKLALGGQYVGGYVASGVGTGSTTATLNVDDGADYQVGAGIVQPYDYSGMTLYEIVSTRSIATNAITLLHPVRTAAVDNGTTHGTITNYVTNDQPTAVSFILEGQESGFAFKLQDCACASVQVQSTPGGFLEATTTWTCGSWSHDNSASALGSYSYSTENFLPVAIGYHGGSFGTHLQGTSTTMTELPCGQISWDITNELVPITGFDGYQGTVQYALTNREIKVSGSIAKSDWATVNIQNSAIATHDNDPAAYELLRFILGDTPGNQLGIIMPRVSYTQFTPEDQGGIQGISFEAVALDHSADTDVSSTPANSPFRIIHG